MAELRSGPKSVSQLVDGTGLKQPNVSNHLSRMRHRGTVRATKVGRQVYYAFGSPEIEGVVNNALQDHPIPCDSIDLDEVRKRYARAAVAGDESTCAEIVDKAFRCGFRLLDIYEGLLTPAMHLVGSWYEVGAVDEGQEHLATATTERMMARVVHMSCPCRRVDAKALLGCAEGNWHSLGLRMISDFLRYSGWKSLFLGPSVPDRAFLAAVEQHRPNIVLTSCCSEEAVSATIDLIGALRELQKKNFAFQIGVGGAKPIQNPDLFTKAGADFVCKDVRDFADRCLPQFEEAV